MTRTRLVWLAAIALMTLSLPAAPAPQQGQPGSEVSPLAALTSALLAACRQNESLFLPYLTEANRAAFRELPSGQRTNLMRRLVRLEAPGRPHVEYTPGGQTRITCDTETAAAVLRLGPERTAENLAFIPLEAGDAQHTVIGMVREGGGWRILSLGVLLLDIPQLRERWAELELEEKERAAILLLRRLRDAIATYRTAFGRLPESLGQLGPSADGQIAPEAAQLIDAELATGEKDGYRFRYRILPAAEAGGEPTYELACAPVQYGVTGRRSFYLDAAGTLRGGDKRGAIATATDPRIEPATRP
ncbi:MAG: hypothetical protein K6U02_01730 [Firmicutes bacterium]|nr:hypothetical protein [Bacillota bacterium]